MKEKHTLLYYNASTYLAGAALTMICASARVCIGTMLYHALHVPANTINMMNTLTQK